MTSSGKSAVGPLAAAWFAAAALAIVLGLAFLTRTVVARERAHARAVAAALFEADLRTALWRLETLWGTLVTTVTARVALEPDEEPRAYSNVLVDAADNRSYPDPSLAPEELLVPVQRADVAFAENAADPPAMEQAEDRAQGKVDYGRRRGLQAGWNRVQVSATSSGAPVLLGPLAPVWQRDAHGAVTDLILGRRIERAGRASYETYRLLWPALEERMLDEVHDLLPDARLVPFEPDEAWSAAAAPPPPRDGEARLAALPLRLEAPPPRAAEAVPRGVLLALGGAWLATLVALTAGGLALRAGLSSADRHRRFTHAVTHELRTPLTTFRLYSEMLAEGMVPADAVPDYLHTLETEAARLSDLVENVLRFARLERGSAPLPRERLTISALVERCAGELVRRAAAAGVVLDVRAELPQGALVDTDPDAVLQVLLNLVENACKYGCPLPGAHVTLHASTADGRLHLEVRDQGPGVPSATRHRIFRPFDRGGRDASDPAPGVGLGLALARRLARELDGELDCLPAPLGARFRLSLPLLERTT